MSLVIRKPDFCLCENKAADQFAVTAKLISAFVFTTPIVQSLFFPDPNFLASSYLLWLYRLVCVRSGQKPRRPVFLHCDSNILESFYLNLYYLCFSIGMAINRNSIYSDIELKDIKFESIKY